MKQKRKLGRKLLSFLLTLAMVLGLMPGMGLTAYAARAALTESSTNWTGDLEAYNAVTINNNVTTAVGYTYLYCTHDVTVNGSLTVNGRLMVYGPGKLYVNGNVVINSGKAIRVTAGDGTQDGVLVAKVSSGDCITGSGTLLVEGHVTASAGEDGVGIKGVSLSCNGTLYGSDAAAINEENKKDSPYQKLGLRNSVDYESHRYMYVDDGLVDAQTLSVGDTFSADLRGIKNCTSLTLQAGGYATESFMPSAEPTPGTDAKIVEVYSNRVSFSQGKIMDRDGELSPYANGKVVNFWQVVSNSEGALVLTGYEISHTHNFTYSASGATITATCTADGCDLPPSTEGATDHVAKLSLVAPTLTQYGETGKSATATLDGVAAFNTAIGKTIATTDIKYVGRGSTTYAESSTAPTNAGTYTAKITVEGKTASLNYEIAKADPTANAPTGLTAQYGKTLSDVTLTNPAGNTDGTWAWVSAGTTSVGNAGDNTFKANFTPTDTNYKTVENVDVTITVGKAANPATVTGTPTVIKGGNTVDLSNNVTMNGATGDVGYAFDGEAKGCTLSGSILTSGNTTGTVTVNVTVAADSNYEALAATPITVTINDKGTQTITASDVTASYGDTDKSVSASVTDPAQGGGAISYAVKNGSADYIDVNATTGALTIKKVPADGKAYVVVTAAETAAYAQATKDVTVTISKENAVPATVTANNRTYDGTEKPLVTVTGEATGGTMNYAIGSDATTAPTEGWGTSIPTATEVGTYFVWYKAAGDSDHNDSGAACVTSVIRGEISQTVTFKVVNGSWDDNTSADKTVTLTGAQGDTLKLTADQIPAVGSKPNDGYQAGSWDTTPNTETAITSNTTYTYTYGDKAENPATVRDTATVMKGGKTVDLAENVTLNGATGAVSYSLSGDAGGCSLNGSILTSGSRPFTVNVDVKVAEDDTYKASDSMRIRVTVTDKPQHVITADDVTATVGDTDKKVTANVTSPETGGGAITYAVKDGSSDYIDVNATTGVLTIKAVPADGKAFVTVTAAETEDYAETTKDVTVTISAAPTPDTPSVTVAPTTLSLVVNGGSQLEVTTVPANAQVTFTTSNEAVATVDGDGIVTAVAPGNAVITATIHVENAVYTGTCAVTVTAESSQSHNVVVPETLSDDNISQEIIERYGSAAQVTLTLEEAMGVTPESRATSRTYDAQVWVETDEGRRPATREDITSDGLEAIFLYPDGTNKDDFIFSGAHMFGETAGGFQAGDIEGLTFRNEDDGLHTIIHGLSPVIITWTRRDTPAAQEEVIDRHVHVYGWDTIEATADQDGEMRYQCRICGDIQTRVPITAYYIFNKETTEKIRRAKQGETVKIETARWISFHKMVMDALADRPDVTLEVSFLDEGHKGTRKNFTIPAGTDTKSLVDDKGFAGFIFLTNKFGN